MGLIEKIQRHLAITSGNFETLLDTIDIPSLDASVSQALNEINKEEPDIEKLETLISASPDLAAKVIQTVNSAFYGLHDSVGSVMHAVSLLGLNNIRSLITAYGAMSAIPKPENSLFDQDAFWTDSLLRAMLARVFAKKKFRAKVDEAYTAALLSDIALPTLLSNWADYYGPVVDEWQNTEQRLSKIERSHFGWDHGQASAWIAKHWKLPEEMVCYMGSHNLEEEELKEMGLFNTIIAPIAVATLTPSVLRLSAERAELQLDKAQQWLEMDTMEYIECINEVSQSVQEILAMFGLNEKRAFEVLDLLKHTLVAS